MTYCKQRLTEWIMGVGLLTPVICLASPFVDTFGTSPGRVSSPYVPQASGAGAVGHYRYAVPGGTYVERTIDDGYYAVVQPRNIISTGGEAYWENAHTGLMANYVDKTGDDGAVLVVNAGLVGNDIYRRIVSLEPATVYTAQAWRFIVTGPTDLYLRVSEPDDSAALSTSPHFVTGNAPAEIGRWERISWTFRTGNCLPGQTYAMKLVNASMVVVGNDLFLDDIALRADPAAAPAAGQADLACPTQAAPMVTAEDDSVSTGVGIAAHIIPLANDASSAGLAAPLAAPTQDGVRAQNGTVVFNADKTVTYTPNAGFQGLDTFTYRVCTEANAVHPTAVCKTARVTVRVGGAANPSAIPTLSEWGVILMSSLIALWGMARTWRQRTTV